MPAHAVCITGLQRSFHEISGNIQAAVASLHGGSDSNVVWFGVRPPQDPWTEVHARLPPLRTEVEQQQCMSGRPITWFSAYARGGPSQFWHTYHVWVQTLCDQLLCDQIIAAHEKSEKVRFQTVARVRLDLAWETTLRPPAVLEPDTVYVPAMNQKAGVNDKFAYGMRGPMRVYLRRAADIVVAESFFNRSTKAEFAGRYGALAQYSCHGALCRPVWGGGHQWQLDHSHRANRHPIVRATENHPAIWETNVTQEGHTKSFKMTSEGFLEWSLWRHNVSVYRQSSWMFCKFSDASNQTARTCVPRFRKRQQCATLHCSANGVDCVCPMTKVSQWCGGKCVDACKSAMRKNGSQILQEPSNGSRPEVCLMPCLKVGSFNGKCVDVRGEQLDELGELF